MTAREEGFSFIELMIVIVIIGIIAAIAVPNLLASRRSANGASAVEATRLFHSTEVTYQAGVGNSSFGTATNLFQQDFIDGVLAGAAGVAPGTKSVSGDQVVPDSTAGKDGYVYRLLLSDDHSRFVVDAVPVGINRTGDRSFFIDETGVIRSHEDCTPPKTWNPNTGKCEPEDAEPTDGIAIGSMLSLDTLANGFALRGILTSPPSQDTIQRIMVMMDVDGDRMLTATEVVNADILGMARQLKDLSFPFSDTNLGGIGRLVKQMADGFTKDLQRELALGVGNEREASVPLDGIISPRDPNRLFGLASLYQTTRPPTNRERRLSCKRPV